MNNENSSSTIGVMGTPVASGNRGVLALGSSLAKLCLECEGIDRVVLLLGNKDNRPFTIRTGSKTLEVEVVNFRLSPKSKINQHLAWIVAASLLYRCLPLKSVREWLKARTPWIKAVANSRFVGDVRGGDSFSDIYGLKRFLTAFLPVWSVILIKKDIVLFPQTYGPYKSAISRFLAKYIVRRSSTAIARDTRSREVAKSLAYSDQDILLSPDVAFSLPPIKPENIATVPTAAGWPDKSSVGININGLMYNGGYNRANMFGLKLDYPEFIKGLIESLLVQQTGDIWLIPHTFAPHGDVESDNEISLVVRNSFSEEDQKRIKAIDCELDQYEIKGLIGMCGFFVGSRMHSCIAALSQAVPCIGVAYSMKFKGVFESVGVGESVIDGRDTNAQDAIEQCSSLLKNRESTANILNETAPAAKQKLSEVFSSLVQSER